MPASATLAKISAISASAAPKRVTTADLNFIDAAINLYQAGNAPAAEGGISASSPIACDPVDVAAAVVAVAVLAYHLYNSCMIGGDVASLQLASRLNVAPNVSLDQLINARNQLASALGVAAGGGEE